LGIILVTGGAGYVGSVLVQELLAADRTVRVLDCLNWGGEPLLGVWDAANFQFMRGDVRAAADRAAALEGVESVIHLAAIVGDPACKQEPEVARRVNLDATRNLIDEAIAGGIRDFIFVSTCSNYGVSDPAELATEKSPLNPVSLYAETKVAAEQYLLARAEGEFVPTVLRLATVYGVSPRMRFDLTVNEFALDAALGKKLVIYGEHHWRPYVHVRDIAQAIMLLLKAPASLHQGQIFNVGHTEENYQKVTMAQILQEMIPGLEIEYVKSGPDPRSYRVSFDKVADVLSFQPRFRLTDGLNEVIRLVQAGVIRDPQARHWRNT
jgi:nucleoside-diphosphate-sugar epimerase